MYSSRNLTYICTALECIEKISIYTQDFVGATELFRANDQPNYNAAWSLLPVIGEESKKLDKDLKAAHATIPWRHLAGMRNYLAHDYRGVDPDIVFDVVKNQLQPLKTTLLAILDEVDYEQEALRIALESFHYSHISYLRQRLK